MIKYAKIINQETKEVSVGLGTDSQYYISIGMTEQDVEEAYNGSWYLVGYAPAKPNPVKVKELEAQVEEKNNALLRDIRVILNPNASAEEKAQAQTYYNNKMAQIDELIEQINELKN